MLWIPFIILIILFIPIRLKLTVLYEDRFINFYIFNWELKIKQKVGEKEANVKNAKKAEKLLKKFLPNDIRKVINNLSKNRFKPKLKLAVQINFGFEDAALTGITTGVFHNFSPVIYELSTKIFNITKYEYTLNPQFNNPMLNIRILSIISINLAKIIYMLYIIYFR
jgi:hypothetical protein